MLFARSMKMLPLLTARCATCKMVGLTRAAADDGGPPSIASLEPTLYGQPIVVGATVVSISLLVVCLTRVLLRMLQRRAEPSLCIHFDVNETIMLGDPAGGDSYEDSLHKILAKIAFVRPVPPTAARGPGRWSAWTWHDGSPLDPLVRDADAPIPPLLPDAFADPEGCVRFYNVPELKRAFAKSFAAEGSPGAIYAGTLEELRQAMRWPDGAPRDPRLCSPEGYHRFLPAFFYTLVELRRRRRPFSVVVRTFGTDLPELIAALDAFAVGAHPLFPGLRAPELTIPPERTWAAFYERAKEDGGVTFTLRPDPGGRQGRAAKLPAGAPAPFATEAAMLAELEGSSVSSRNGAASWVRLSAVQDDYNFWKAASYSPSAGKPLWLSLHALDAAAAGCRHIFFDDNIHCDAQDSIVAVRARASAAQHVAFTPVSGKGTVALHGAVLRKVPTAMPVRQHGWFLEQIALCEARIDDLLERDAKGKPGGFVDILGL